MVQRKVSNKLGIQADHVKSERRLANLKSSSYQYQDGKNRGPDMKKKMKRSRSIKLSDIESLRSSSALKQTISLPGKPPPLHVTTPQKQQTPVRANYGSPNYMKGTSSSEARKETAQVSSRRISSNSLSKLGSGSSTQPARSLKKSSSLKRVRTLTKTPSFKPVRAGSKKCSRVVICADVNAQRATCSSTLKKSKFPDYLVLNHGGTEIEGTSVMKVCPYTYCSLNGHHHKPLLPLKCFLSARRRMMKTHKSMKLEALSPPRVKPADEGIDVGHIIYENRPPYKEGDLDSSPMSPLIQEEGKDFFIKIYARSKEEDAESIHRDCHEAEVEHINDEQIAEDLSAGSLHSEIDFEENLEQYSTSMGVYMMECSTEEDIVVEDPDKDYSAGEAQSEVVPEDGSDFEVESNASTEDDGSISEGSDMEWEEGQFPIIEIDTKADDSAKDDYESDFDNGYLSEINYHGLPGEPITKSDSTVVNGSEKIQADEIIGGGSACSETLQGGSDFEMDDKHQNLEIVESCQVSESDQESTTEKAVAALVEVMITSAWTEDPVVEPTASLEEKSEIPEAENKIPGPGPCVGYVENYYNPDAMSETFNRQQREKSVQDDDLAMWLQNQISNSFQDSANGDQVITDEDYNGKQDIEGPIRDSVAISEFHVDQDTLKNEAGVQTEEREQFAVTKRSIGVQVPDDLFEAYLDDAKVDDNLNHNIIDPCQLEDYAEDSNLSQDTVDELPPAENQEHPSEGEYNGTDVAGNPNFVGIDEDKEEVKNFNVLISKDSEESDSGINKISLAENDIGVAEKMEFEESSESDTTEALPETGETIPKLESASLPLESESNMELSTNDQEMSTTDGDQKWAIRSKGPANNEEEMKNFNPREPNFLPVVPDPESEKVDLKHQMMDERKNSEEWMVDYALRQAVTKLAPDRKRKVALLVEAFETVIPVPKWETRLRHSSEVFTPARPMQACS